MFRLPTKTRVEIFFGRKCRVAFDQHRLVTLGEWQNFMDDVIIPRFPGGFTVAEVQGYTAKDGHESTFALTAYFGQADNSNALEAKIREVCELYAIRFDQRAVFYGITPAECASISVPRRGNT